jgi:hypothetical protein
MRPGRGGVDAVLAKLRDRDRHGFIQRFGFNIDGMVDAVSSV